jgi:indole-3-glycerol phosphate synthase
VVATYLDSILVAHRRRAAADTRPRGMLEQMVADLPPTRGFSEALSARRANDHEIAVIAEIKRRSPSRGDLALALDPAVLAGEYARGGAAALSVLTDEEFFSGAVSDLQAARDAVALPVLRKDFTVSFRDLYDARAMGADAALLIVAALAQDELAELVTLAYELGLSALVEVHDEAELTRALDAGATLVGVNQRDLHTFEVDTDRAVRVGEAMPDDVVRVAESGVRVPADVSRLFDAGFHAVLVGETLVRADDPAEALRQLRSGRVASK